MTAALAILLLGTQTPAESSIKFSGSSFAIQVDDKKIDMPLREAAPKPAENVVFRKGDKFVVWDVKRGLTIRSGRWARTSRLSDAATSPRLSTRDQIRRTLDLIS